MISSGLLTTFYLEFPNMKTQFSQGAGSSRDIGCNLRWKRTMIVHC